MWTTRPSLVGDDLDVDSEIFTGRRWFRCRQWDLHWPVWRCERWPSLYLRRPCRVSPCRVSPCPRPWYCRAEWRPSDPGLSGGGSCNQQQRRQTAASAMTALLQLSYISGALLHLSYRPVGLYSTCPTGQWGFTPPVLQASGASLHLSYRPVGLHSTCPTGQWGVTPPVLQASGALLHLSYRPVGLHSTCPTGQWGVTPPVLQASGAPCTYQHHNHCQLNQK